MSQPTDEQLENYRNVLVLQFGACALIMPKEELKKHHEKMQQWLDSQGISLHLEKNG